jgi:DNA invertase Pin-like site-specific DNA recombinase
VNWKLVGGIIIAGKPSSHNARKGGGLMAIFGYIREVLEEGPDSPAFKIRGISDMIYMEEASSILAGRPRLNKLLAEIGSGDALVTASFSELAGSSQGLLQMAGALEAKGSYLVSLKEGLDTRTAEGKAVIRAMMSLKELDEDSMAEWTRNRVDYIKKNASPKHRIGHKK